MPTSPWPRRKRSTKRDGEGAGAGVGAASAATPLPLETRGLDSRGSGVAAEAAPTAEPARRRPSIRKIALDILARREHSVAELREKLHLREFPEDEIEATLQALISEGLLSEARFLETFVGSHARRGHGPVWIRAELERKGIAGEAIREAIESAGVDWDAAAEAVRVKRFGPAVPADFRERARQARFLQYRGYRTRLLD